MNLCLLSKNTMGSFHDDDKSREGDASTTINVEDTNHVEEGEQAEEMTDGDAQQPHDIWAGHGYTPLADLSNPYQTLMVAMGPNYNNESDDDNDENDNGQQPAQSAFFVDPTAFVPSPGPRNLWGRNYDNYTTNDNDDDDDDNEEWKEIETQELEPTPDPEANFAALADQALHALDQEYERTLRGEPQPQIMQGLQPTHPPSELPNKSVIDDEDSNIIAAAFDQHRKRQQKQSSGDDGDPSFPVDWENVDQKPSTSTKTLPEVNTPALKRAVQAISTQNTHFQAKFDSWQQTQTKTKQPPTQPPHALLPPALLQAFAKTNQKQQVQLLTHQASRSATLAEAMVRCNLLLEHDTPQKDTLTIHIMGVDHVECASAGTIRTLFGPLVQWMDAFLNKAAAQAPQQQQTSSSACSTSSTSSIRHVRLVLIGRDLTPNQEFVSVNLLSPSPPDTAAAATTTTSFSTLVTATASSHAGVYHEWLEQQQLVDPEASSASTCATADLVVAFNAGIWGYREWEPTLEYLCRCSTKTNVVITSYTLAEAQDDAEVIQRVVRNETTVAAANENTTTTTDCPSSTDDSSSACLLWAAEANPFGSKQSRETHSSTRDYRENAAWQAWALGGGGAPAT
jgi:hypothetical protein